MHNPQCAGKPYSATFLVAYPTAMHDPVVGAMMVSPVFMDIYFQISFYFLLPNFFSYLLSTSDYVLRIIITSNHLLTDQISSMLVHEMRARAPLNPWEWECMYLQHLWWLHFPKCGTSFSVSVAPYRRDPSRPKSKMHPPLAKSTRKVVAIFRSPEARLRSAYHWMQVRPACCNNEWGWSKSMREEAGSMIKSGVPPNRTMSRFLGCQTNMVLGLGCMSAAQHTEQTVRRAIRKMMGFKFVGVQESWLLSICLFNAIFTGTRFVLQEQLLNVRPTFGSYDRTIPMPKDWADDALYAAVLERFAKDLKSHGVADNRSCPIITNASALRVYRQEGESEEQFAGRVMAAATRGSNSSYRGTIIMDTWDTYSPDIPPTPAKQVGFVRPNHPPVNLPINFPGADLTGVLLRPEDHSSAESCHQACQRFSSCHAFTFIPKWTNKHLRRRCWLKNRDYSSRQETNPATIGGVVRPVGTKERASPRSLSLRGLKKSVLAAPELSARDLRTLTEQYRAAAASTHNASQQEIRKQFLRLHTCQLAHPAAKCANISKRLDCGEPGWFCAGCPDDSVPLVIPLMQGEELNCTKTPTARTCQFCAGRVVRCVGRCDSVEQVFATADSGNYLHGAHREGDVVNRYELCPYPRICSVVASEYGSSAIMRTSRLVPRATIS